MAYLDADLESIEQAIAKGFLTVRHSDGKTVTYRSISELKEARDIIKKALAKNTKRPARAFVARTNKGL